MGKFNTARKEAVTKTTNLAGGEAYQESTKLEFVSILLTSFVKDQFYRSEADGLDRARELIEILCKHDPKFVAKAAVYARTEFGMRSISHVVAGELFRKRKNGSVSGEPWVKNFINKVCYRADDGGEILSYFMSKVKEKDGAIPNQLRKGLALAMSRLDAYQLAKYRGEGKGFKQVDIANLVHPKHTDAISDLVNDKLKSADTWETKLTQAGQKASSDEEKEELKGAAWKELIGERKIGYFALLRNLRNILTQAPDMIPAACEMLTDERLIKKSLVLPFRFTTALTELEKVASSSKLLVALNKAVDISCSNVPKFDGKTLVVLDTSGSMHGKPAEIGSLFSAILVKSNDADFMTFSDDARYKSVNPLDSTLTIAKSLKFSSGGTNFHSIFQMAREAYDRVVILSDMQGWVHHDTPTADFGRYKAKFGCKTKVYSFDLAGHGTLQFPENDVYCLAGFSDKVFDLMKMLESDREAMISSIEKVTFE